MEAANDILKEWQQTWYGMADGDLAQYNQIKRMEVTEFFTVYDQWAKKMEAMAAAHKKNSRTRKT